MCFSLPVYKDDACDEKSHSYGKEVRQRHVVIVMIQYAARRGSIGEGGIGMAPIDPAALLQCVVSIVPIIHHAVCKIALKQEETWKLSLWSLSIKARLATAPTFFHVLVIFQNSEGLLARGIFCKLSLCTIITQHATYRSSEELQSGEGAFFCRGIRRKQRLRKHQERPSHQEQEDIEEE